MKGILNKNGDLSVKGIILAVLVTVVVAVLLDCGANFLRGYAAQEPVEQGTGVYGYNSSSVLYYTPEDETIRTVKVNDEGVKTADPYVHVYPVKNVKKVGKDI